MSKKTVNSDIYNIAQLVDDVKSVYIPDETSDTLAVGMYGYIGDLESHRLQTQVQMTGELANEVFPSRARLERNIITHAIMASIEDINAIPAKMNVFIAIKESDITKNLNENNNFVIDRECPIYIGDYEFHLEYSIVLKQIYIKNKKANSYSATYIMDSNREVPTSTISNRYLSPPAVVYTNNDTYVYITASLAQVTHYEVNKKLVTTNVVDNKTLTFEFDDQLAYFDVEIEESDETKYLQPVFEGSSVPDNAYKYYCWYQYIDTNTIRIRFDRGSYIPGLNAAISVKVKTSKGAEGNFTYNDSCAVTLSSTVESNDGSGKVYTQYSNVASIVTPIGNSTGGKDRKSKSELQKLIPRELLSRGSLTTITDLNNYMSTLDTEDGRVVIQKKIDNQIERVYYAYLVAKDTDGNVIPSNTIDLKIGMEDLIESKMTEAISSRFILKSGQCIKLDSSGMGYINHDPIMTTQHSFTPMAASRGEEIVTNFKIKVTEDGLENYAICAKVGDASTGIQVTPKKAIVFEDANAPIELEDYLQLSAGQEYVAKGTYTVKNDGSMNIDIESDNATIVGGTYKIGSNTIKTINADQFPFEIQNLTQGDQVAITITYRFLGGTSTLANLGFMVYADGAYETYSYTCFCPLLTTTSNIPNPPTYGTEVEYELRYASESAKLTPEVLITLSDGVEYVPFSLNISYEDGLSYETEPTESDINNDNLLYTNPYSISINGYHLYSAFYMMTMNENPYLHFDWVNEASNVQFIATNATWTKDFLGDYKDKYRLSINVTQSVQANLGVIPDNSEPEIKAIAVFERENKHYRYRSLDLESYDANNYSFTFSKNFICTDILDNDNNIKVENVEAPGTLESAICTYTFSDGTTTFDHICDGSFSEDIVSFLNRFGITDTYVDSYSSNNNLLEVEVVEKDDGSILSTTFKILDQFNTDQYVNITAGDTDHKITVSCKYLEYGYFNPTTDVKIYILSKVPNVSSNPTLDGTYDKYDLESFCPLVDKNWTVTNIYSIVNGVSFYYNYSEIMGSRAIPYGTESKDPDTGTITMKPTGYCVYSVPVFGYKYCQDETLIQGAIDALNYRKGYIDNAVSVLENSFGVDFKLFNTYGPSKTYYIMKDENRDSVLNDSKEYIDRVDISMYFRVKLVASKDSYTKANIIKEIKDYMEDLDDLSELHIPNLITQITTNYKEQITYFEYLGFNDYGPEVQHIYKDSDDSIAIHTAPEFVNIRNSIDIDGSLTPDINIYVSEM